VLPTTKIYHRDSNSSNGPVNGGRPQDRILTIREVAEELRLHRSTISRLAKSGELRSYIIGARRLFKESEVQAFFDNQVDRRCVAREEI
jgi:excisionase family DNA binding protein